MSSYLQEYTQYPVDYTYNTIPLKLAPVMPLVENACKTYLCLLNFRLDSQSEDNIEDMVTAKFTNPVKPVNLKPTNPKPVNLQLSKPARQPDDEFVEAFNDVSYLWATKHNWFNLNYVL